MILVIDDSKDMADLFKIVLEGEGFRVKSVQSGDHALEALRSGIVPRLIFLDRCMHGMSGEDFLSEFASAFPELSLRVPIIVVSGLDDRLSNRLVKGYLRKPVDVADLVNMAQAYAVPGGQN